MFEKIKQLLGFKGKEEKKVNLDKVKALVVIFADV